MKKIFYGRAVYNQREINAVTKVLKNSSLSLMDGTNVKLFEKKISNLFGKKHGLMVNSGSSANLLALSSLGLKKNSEIITPLLTFSTTVAPIYQLGLIPRFVDVDLNSLQIDIDLIQRNINKNTSAILVPNLIGNVSDWRYLHNIAKKNNIFLIEDSADTVGYTINKKKTGKFSDIVTTSFYASHIITGAGFGGMVCFNSKKHYEKGLLLRGWGRSSSTFKETENIKDRFKKKIYGMRYDGKYIFEEMGYNFLPSDIAAAFGLVQLTKLKKNIARRVYNFNFLIKNLKKYSRYIYFMTIHKKVKTAVLAFPIIIKNNKLFSREEMQIFLEKNNIQTRTIFTGNILRQPVMKSRKFKVDKSRGKNSDRIMRNGILLGCHHGLEKKDLVYMIKTIQKFFLSKKIII